MTPEQEKLTDDIILLHKRDNGVFEWRDFVIDEIMKESNGLPYRSIMFVKDELMKKGLIEFYFQGDRLTTRLTSKGQGWKSMAYHKAQETKAKRKEWIESVPKRFWYIVAIITYVAGVCSDKVKEILFSEPQTVIMQSNTQTTANDSVRLLKPSSIPHIVNKP